MYKLSIIIVKHLISLLYPTAYRYKIKHPYKNEKLYKENIQGGKLQMAIKHKKICSTSLIFKEMQVKITVIQFTTRMKMEKTWRSGHPPKLVLAELVFIGWYIPLYLNLYSLMFLFSNSPCRTLYNRDPNELAEGINYNNVAIGGKIRNNLNTYQ